MSHMKMLTPKQERFCQEIVIGQALSAAYGAAFAPKTMSKKTVNEKACRLAKLGKIRQGSTSFGLRWWHRCNERWQTV